MSDEAENSSQGHEMTSAGDQPRPLTLFYSYSHKDEALREKLAASVSASSGTHKGSGEVTCTATSQIAAVLSHEAVTTRRPSGLRLALTTRF